MSEPCKRMSLRFDDWPSVDRSAFEIATRKGDILDPGGLASDWRPSTVGLMVEGYGAWLAWLARAGCLGRVNDPAARCTPARLSAWLHAMQDRDLRPATIATQLRCLCRMLAVMSPEADLAFLRATLRQIDTQHGSLKAAKLRSAGELFALGLDLMEEADRSDARLKNRARLYRNGLLIAFLSLRPLRRRNVAGLVLGRHLRQTPTGWRIVIPGDEMKNGYALDEPFPELLVPYLERYLGDYRCALAPVGVALDPWSGPVWISGRSGKAMSGHTMNLTVGAITEERFGRPVNLNLFRDIAATTLAIEDPEHVRLGAAINGHRDYRTTQRSYNLSRMHHAAVAYQDTLAALREELDR